MTPGEDNMVAHGEPDVDAWKALQKLDKELRVLGTRQRIIYEQIAVLLRAAVTAEVERQRAKKK